VYYTDQKVKHRGMQGKGEHAKTTSYSKGTNSRSVIEGYRNMRRREIPVNQRGKGKESGHKNDATKKRGKTSKLTYQ